jgi:hypothetical protein
LVKGTILYLVLEHAIHTFFAINLKKVKEIVVGWVCGTVRMEEKTDLYKNFVRHCDESRPV